MRHHLAEAGRADEPFGRELLTLFARGARQSADYVRVWRDLGGTHAAVPSMGHGFGRDIEAHIDFLAEVRRQIDE